MQLDIKGVAAVLCWLAGTATGCGPGPFQRAASSYAAVSGQSASALATAPDTAARICRKKAHIAYLEVRLGLMSTPAPIPWNTWYTTAPATDTQTWERYCQELRDTGTVFAIAVGAVRQYGAALQTLSAGGTYDGSDFQKIAASAGKIAGKLGDTGAAAAIKPAGTLVGKFAGFLLESAAEGKIEDYMRRADPLLQPILAALDRYVEAIDGELRVTENAQRQTLLALEARGDLLDGIADPGKLIPFYGFALATEDDIDSTRTILNGYRGVLSGLRNAHRGVLEAAEKGSPPDIKKAAGAVFELATQLQALNSALSKE